LVYVVVEVLIGKSVGFKIDDPPSSPTVVLIQYWNHSRFIDTSVYYSWILERILLFNILSVAVVRRFSLRNIIC
jgi:hypothetical protein